jgi:hypothetical protein
MSNSIVYNHHVGAAVFRKRVKDTREEIIAKIIRGENNINKCLEALVFKTFTLYFSVLEKLLVSQLIK